MRETDRVLGTLGAMISVTGWGFGSPAVSWIHDSIRS